MGLRSMTGFAARSGQSDGLDWVWEVRAVNARGLDVRVRLPEGLDTLEPAVRAAAKKALARGALQVSLRVNLAGGDAGVALNTAALDQLLSIARDAADRAAAAGVAVAAPGLGDLLSQRGVLESRRVGDAVVGVTDEIAADLPDLFAALDAHRAQEGAALEQVLREQIDRVAALSADAAATAEARAARAGDVLAARVKTLLQGADVEPERLAQELALLAVKSDITEEIDRLDAHVRAARDHLDGDGPAGRQLDFLMQEFNREANTLCSKSGDTALTEVGLDLKLTIDQMREQVQNLE